MNWSAIILSLIQVFGPLILKWLERRFQQAAETLPTVATYATVAAARNALFDAVIAGLPRFAFARRTFVRRLKAAAEKAGVTGDPEAATLLDPAEVIELEDAAGAAFNEANTVAALGNE